MRHLASGSGAEREVRREGWAVHLEEEEDTEERMAAAAAEVVDTVRCLL
jgi:hypothetical protein